MMPAALAHRTTGRSVVSRARAGLQDLPWRPVLRSFLAARLVVLVALGIATLIAQRHPELTRDTLLGWDADWYRKIARDGYGGLPGEAVRFFPLLPLLVRGLGAVLGSRDAAQLLITNACALVYAFLLHRLALREGLSRAVADRTVWVAAFTPAGFVLVMGYTEPLFGVLLCGMLLLARDRRWLAVAALGALAGALRPPGVVLAPVVLVEVLRGVRRTDLRAWSLREWALRALAVAGPVLGLASYLAWTGVVYDDPLRPFSVQTDPGLRGGTFVDPLLGIRAMLQGLVHGRVEGSGWHVLSALVALALLVVVVRRLPPSHTVLTVLVLGLAVTARTMNSFERYAASAVPLLLAAALVLDARPGLRRVTLVLSPAVLGVCAVLAFVHLYVP